MRNYSSYLEKLTLTERQNLTLNHMEQPKLTLMEQEGSKLMEPVTTSHLALEILSHTVHRA